MAKEKQRQRQRQWNQSLRPSGYAPAFGRAEAASRPGFDAGLKPSSISKARACERATAGPSTTSFAKCANDFALDDTFVSGLRGRANAMAGREKRYILARRGCRGSEWVGIAGSSARYFFRSSWCRQ